MSTDDFLFSNLIIFHHLFYFWLYVEENNKMASQMIEMNQPFLVVLVGTTRTNHLTMCVPRANK